MNYFKKGILFSLLFLTVGCSSIFTMKDEVRYFYVLNAIPSISVVHTAPVRLMVQTPAVPEWLASKRIVLMRSQNQLDFYSHARWGANLSQMLGRVISDSLTNNRVARDIIYSDSSAQTDYMMVTEVLAFQAEYRDMREAPVVHTQIQVKLLDGKGKLIHQFTVENYTPSKQNKLSAIVEAFELSNQGCLEKIVENISRYLARA